MYFGAFSLAAFAVAATDPGTSVGGFNLLAPIVSTGIVGVLFIMVLFRIKIMPTYVYDDAMEQKDKEIARLEKDNGELKESNQALRTLTEQQIIPALVRANQLSADYASDLAAERRRHGSG